MFLLYISVEQVQGTDSQTLAYRRPISYDSKKSVILLFICFMACSSKTIVPRSLSYTVSTGSNRWTAVVKGAFVDTHAFVDTKY